MSQQTNPARIDGPERGVITMDEYTKADTSGRARKRILQGGAAGGLILVGSVLLAIFSPIGATPAEPAAESQACEHAHQRPGEMRPRLDRGKGHDMGAMGSMGRGHEMGEGHAMGEMGGRPAARMGAAVGGQVGEFLGMDRRELGEALRGGASIADLAGDRADELVADLVARGTERIEQAVADGRLDRERADGILSRVEERITARLEGGHPAGS
ncbi:MAG: hypothetical protein MK182_06995 [Acidimicrobiales bacterium]|nr:hypothetical protein [Acidimicrobiales bacterium]